MNTFKADLDEIRRRARQHMEEGPITEAYQADADKVIDVLNEVLATEETRKFLNSFGGDPFIATPDEGQALFRQGVKDWEGYVRAASIEPQ